MTYHQLGLLHAVIAVPWMIQIGFVQALPLLIEQMIQQGFWEGIILFLTQLPFGLVFFVFHLRTKAYFFEQGLFSGKGGYKVFIRKREVERYYVYFFYILLLSSTLTDLMNRERAEDLDLTGCHSLRSTSVTSTHTSITPSYYSPQRCCTGSSALKRRSLTFYVLPVFC